MFSKAMIGLSAAIVLCAAATQPAIGASAKSRVVVRPAASQLPPPAYGPRSDGRAHSSNPAHDVYVDGKYAGSDPDPFIRGRLVSDPPWNYSR